MESEYFEEKSPKRMMFQWMIEVFNKKRCQYKNCFNGFRKIKSAFERKCRNGGERFCKILAKELKKLSAQPEIYCRKTVQHEDAQVFYHRNWEELNFLKNMWMPFNGWGTISNNFE